MVKTGGTCDLVSAYKKGHKYASCGKRDSIQNLNQRKFVPLPV
jgi:hypothetical protein